MTAPWMPTLRLSSRMAFSRFGSSRTARTIRLALLSLVLLCGGTSLGNAAINCSTSIPCKEIWFFNNSTETLHPVLFIGRRGVDEWLQAYTQASPVQRNTAKWPTTRDSRVYVNGKTGIPPKGTLINGVPANGFAKIRLPLLTVLSGWNEAIAGITPDSVVDWWNGGRVEIFDDAKTIADQYDIDVALPSPQGVINPAELNKKISGNAFVECVEGDCKGLTMIQRSGGDFDNSAPYQLTEFTFGSAQTGDLFANTPYGWVPSDVGYNLSMVDSTYLPAAMEPLNNDVIPYIGSVMAPADFRLKMQQWLKDHDGYPIYKTSTLARPKIPQSFDVFAGAFFQFKDTYNSSSNFNFDPNGTAGNNWGKPINDMINLYLKCKDASSADPTTTCGKIYNLEHNLFGPNLAKYMTYPCAVFEDPVGSGTNKPFPDTVAWRLWTLYGWVPYNFTFGVGTASSCGDKNSTPPFTGNSLFDTVTKDAYQQLADSYRLNTPTTTGLQYNYLTETDQTQWFNPYVELLHSAKYLNLGVYAFSIDDAVGFQQHKGEGLIYAVGGTNGLQNTHELDPNAILNVNFGQATNGTTYTWQKSAYRCNDQILHEVTFTDFPSYDFFPVNSGGYPCRVAALLNNPTQTLYWFEITHGPGGTGGTTVNCSPVTDPVVKDWCSRITVTGLPQTPNHLDHIIGPAVNK